MNRFTMIAAATVALSACHFSDAGETKDRDPGPETSRAYQLGTFDKIEVAGPYNVKVSTGGQPGANATGGSALLDETDVVVENGTLRIMPKKHKGIRFSWRSGAATFTVTTAALRSAAIAGSGDIEVDKISGDFDGDVAGSGDLKIGQASGGALKFSIAGSGGVSAAGTAESVDLNIAGSGDIDLGNVAAKTADVSIAGSGDVRAKASDTAKVSILGSGSVDIAGGAKCSISKAGSGDVTCH